MSSAIVITAAVAILVVASVATVTQVQMAHWRRDWPPELRWWPQIRRKLRMR